MNTLQPRHTPVNPLPADAIRQMLQEKNFFDFDYNKSGKGLPHQ